MSFIVDTKPSAGYKRVGEQIKCFVRRWNQEQPIHHESVQNFKFEANVASPLAIFRTSPNWFGRPKVDDALDQIHHETSPTAIDIFFIFAKSYLHIYSIDTIVG